MAAALSKQIISANLEPNDKRPNPFDAVGQLCFAHLPPKAVLDDYNGMMESQIVPHTLKILNGGVDLQTENRQIIDDLSKETLEKARAVAEHIVPLEMFSRISGALHLNAFDAGAHSALYHTGSFFNHSCQPNVRWTVVSTDHDSNSSRSQADICYPIMSFVLTRDVQQGEELFISYTDTEQPGEVRRKHLQWGYGFECDCKRCQGLANES